MVEGKAATKPGARMRDAFTWSAAALSASPTEQQGARARQLLTENYHQGLGYQD